MLTEEPVVRECALVEAWVLCQLPFSTSLTSVETISEFLDDRGYLVPDMA